MHMQYQGRPLAKSGILNLKASFRASYRASSQTRSETSEKTLISLLYKIFFDKYESLHLHFDGIPPEHLWNEDEKGVQMGGGRKNNGKFYYFKDQKNCYRLGNDNLELVAVMECVSAAGDVMPPSLVLSDGPEPDLRHDLKVEDFGRYVILIFFKSLIVLT